MANQDRNGRNVATPDENRPSWRPQDDGGQRSRRSPSDSDDHRERGWDSHWDDRSTRIMSDDDRDERATERYGQGQSGYGAGRYEGDRSFGSRHQASPYDQPSSDRGTDERFTGGRGGESWSPMDRDDRGAMHGSSYGPPYGNYGHAGDWEQRGGSGYLGQGGQQMGWSEPSSQAGGRSLQGPGGLYGQGGYDEGMYGRGGMESRYGSSESGSRRYGGYGGQPPHTTGYGQGMGQRGQITTHYGQPGLGGHGPHRGKGPAGYTRSDERIREMVCDVLTDHEYIDASNIEVAVKNGDVILSGTVDDRRQKRLAEDVIENLSGVKEVTNQLRVRERTSSSAVDASGREQGQQSGASSGDKRHRA